MQKKIVALSLLVMMSTNLVANTFGEKVQGFGKDLMGSIKGFEINQFVKDHKKALVVTAVVTAAIYLVYQSRFCPKPRNVEN